MGRVAACAVAAFYWFAQLLILRILLRQFLEFHCIPVALPANIDQGASQKLLLLGGMWIMAIHAPDLID